MIESFSEGNTLIIKLCPMWSAKDDSIIVHFRGRFTSQRMRIALPPFKCQFRLSF